MDRNELPLEPRHLVVPSGVSKPISKPTVHLAQTMHRSCTDTNAVSKRKEVRLHMTHITKEFHQVCPKRYPSLWYVRHKSCTYLEPRLAQSPNGPKWAFIWTSSPRGTIGYIQNDFLSRWYIWSKPYTNLAPTLILSPKRNKWDFTWPTSPWSSIGCVQNPSLWYIWHKLYTYHASRLALCPKGPEQASTWASSPSGTIGCVQNYFWAYGTSSANHEPILH
jgi:hypothetical protein